MMESKLALDNDRKQSKCFLSCTYAKEVAPPLFVDEINAFFLSSLQTWIRLAQRTLALAFCKYPNQGTQFFNAEIE